MLKHVVDAPFRSRWVGIAGDQSFVAALLPHAELGGHGDHQLLPVGHKSNPINRGVLQGSLLTPCFDRCFDEFLQWSPFLSPELAQLDGSPQSRGIRGETDVRKVLLPSPGERRTMLPSWAMQRQIALVLSRFCRKVSSPLSMLVVVPRPSKSPAKGMCVIGRCSWMSPWMRLITELAMVRSATVPSFGF